MGAIRTYEEINEKIRNGNVVVMSAEEIVALVDEKGLDEAFDKVDVVTAATFGPMCSSGAFVNFGHSNPPIRMEDITMNNVSVYGGLAAVDTYIGATQESLDQGYEYGGAHVICDLLAGKEVAVKATAKGTDCYPTKKVEYTVTLDALNEAYMFNPRNCYQNYAAAINTTDKNVYTYMGVLQKQMGNVNYSTTGTLSPLLNDPNFRTIGMGTRIYFAGAQGYVSWQGTQFNTAAARDENGIPIGTGGTLALIGDMKAMNPKYIKPAVFEGYGTSLYVGVAFPIPVLDKELLAQMALGNDKIFTNVIDYGKPGRSKDTVARVSYEELMSGSIEVDGKRIKTAGISSIPLSRALAKELQAEIEAGKFLLQEPIQMFPQNSVTKAMNDDKVVLG